MRFQRSPLLWLHNKWHLFGAKAKWFGISMLLLHGHLEIQNLSSHVKTYSSANTQRENSYLGHVICSLSIYLYTCMTF